jgi:hypothetical protein
MSIMKILGGFLIGAIVMTYGAEVGEQLDIPGSETLVSSAGARVGRPLTPVSVAGAARRTVRRCAVGVYNCSLPDFQSQEGQMGLVDTGLRFSSNISNRPIVAMKLNGLEQPWLQ